MKMLEVIKNKENKSYFTSFDMFNKKQLKVYPCKFTDIF